MEENAWNTRTILAMGNEKVAKLENANVLVVGLGGVGAYAAEQICRAGVGKMTIVDGDKIMPTNRNRQLPALKSNEGRMKAQVMGERLLDINSKLNLQIIDYFIINAQIDELLAQPFDYVVDAIDTLTPKIELIYYSWKRKLPIISSMGAGGRFDPAKVEIADISKSYNCTLARMLRKHLHRLGVRTGVKVVFSSEQLSKKQVQLIENEPNKRTTVGTISYMPPIFGCFCASVVIRDLIAE